MDPLTTVDFVLSPRGKLRISWNHCSSLIQLNSIASPAHIHPFYEMYVYISGDCSFAVDGQIYRMSQGDIIFTRPNQYHHCIYHKDCIHEHFCICFYSSDPGITALFDRLSRRVWLRMQDEDRREILSLLYEINYSLQENGSLGSFAQLSSFYRLLSLLEHNTDCTQTPVYPESLHTILRHIDRNFHRIRSVKELTQYYFLSQSTIERMFKQYLHTTPYQYIEARKLAGACCALCEGKSVTEAAIESGFSDCSHFIFLFRKHFNITPYRYKKYVYQLENGSAETDT